MRKWPWVLLAFIVLFIVVIRYSLTSNYVLEKVKDRIESAVVEQTGATFTVGSMSGDLLNSIRLTDIRLETDEPLIHIDSLDFTYKVSSLFYRKLVITRLAIWGPDVFITQKSDSLWNFSPLIQTDNEKSEPLNFDFILDELTLQNGSISLQTSDLPDASITIEKFLIQAHASFVGGAAAFSVEELSFQLMEGRLPEPIRFDTRAHYSEDTITLDKLLIHTGRSLVESSGSWNMETDELLSQLDGEPIARADIAAYLDSLPAFDTARFSFSTTGSFSDLNVQTSLKADGLIDAELRLEISLKPVLAIKAVDLNVREFYSKHVPGLEDVDDFTAGILRLQASGHAEPDNMELAKLTGSINLGRTSWQHIDLEQFSSTFELNEGSLQTQLNSDFQGQRVIINVDASNLFGDMDAISWTLQSTFQGLNAGYFLDDKALKTNLAGNLTANGTGIEPGSKPWNVDLALASPELADYAFDEVTIQAVLDAKNARVESQVIAGESSIDLEGTFVEWQSEWPVWDIKGTINTVDVETLLGLEGIRTNLNASFAGDGRGFEPDQANGEIRLNIHPSMIIQQRIDSAFVDIRISDSILEVPNAFISSRFLNAKLTARQNLNDISDTQNRLDYQATISNLEPFADVIGLDSLTVKGTFQGEMTMQDGVLKLDNQFNFESFSVNKIQADEITGNLGILFNDEPEVTLSAEIISPYYQQISIKDIRFDARLLIAEMITGESQLQITRDEEYGLTHQASFIQDGERIVITTNELEIFEEDFDLFLQNPFDVRIFDNGIETDTMRVVSTSGSYMQAYFASDTAANMIVFFEAADIDIGALQSVILDEVIVAGYFSGKIDAHLPANDQLKVDLTARVDSILASGLDLDQLNLDVHIENERLKSTLFVQRQGDVIIESEFDLPFRKGNPELFSEEFFDEPVSGYVRLKPQLLEDYQPFLQNFRLGTITGRIQGNLALDGKAGEPDLDVMFSLKEGFLSGVPVDSLSLKLDYEHDDGRMLVQSEMISQGQQVLEIDGMFPFFIDWRTFQIKEIEGSENIEFTMNSNELNMNAFEGFLDRDQSRSIRGRLTTEIKVDGTVIEPDVNGTIRLRGGRVFLVENNVTISDIRMDARLIPGEFILERLVAESQGILNLNGTLKLDGFNPESFDFSANAQRFRIFDTRDMEVLATLTARLSGTEQSPKLTGNILFDRGYIYLDNFGEATLEEVILEEEEAPSTFLDDIYDRSAIEMIVRTDRRFFVRNRNRPELDLELEGTIDAVKESGRDLQLFGDMNVVRGTANQLGRRFELDEGQVLFSGPPNNPELSIRLKYELRREDDITIWYVITGDVQEPIFSYESDPQMELQDIISFTIFGRPFNALAGWQQGISGGAGGSNIVADAALDLLIERLESFTSERLGIDVLEIDQSSGNAGSSIKAGKYFGDKLFVAIVQELGSDPVSQVIIEYLLRRNLELIFTGSDDYRTGVDVRWRLDY